MNSFQLISYFDPPYNHFTKMKPCQIFYHAKVLQESSSTQDNSNDSCYFTYLNNDMVQCKRLTGFPFGFKFSIRLRMPTERTTIGLSGPSSANHTHERSSKIFTPESNTVSFRRSRIEKKQLEHLFLTHIQKSHF